MEKTELINMLNGLRETCPRCNDQMDYGYNKAINTACSLIEAYWE